MKKLFDIFNRIHFTEKSVPWVLLTACVLAFGLLTSQLGFFQDDWNYVFNHYLFGAEGINDFLSYDARPFAAWVYNFGFTILGYHPLGWHITVLILRWLTATVLWMVFKALWPKNDWQNLVAALLFSLYPFFTLQPLAVAYSLHWTGYFLYAISIYLMLTALKKRFWVYTLLALLTQALHLFTLEFYTGIDLLRPVFLWLVLSASETSTRKKLLTTLRQWAPYLAIFILYFVWRGFIYQAAAEGRNTPLLFTAFINDPLATTISTINNGLPDLVLILITSWYKIIQPENFNFSISANRYIIFISAIGFGIFYLFFSRTKQLKKERDSSAKSMLVVGIVALLLSMIPVYAAEYVIHLKNEPWNSRFSLGALLGAALIITGLIDILIKVPKTRWVFLSTIFGLLIGWHLNYTNDFRWAWSKQVNFYRQLYLRAPELTSNTAILSEGELFLYMGDYPTAYGINVIYTPQGNTFQDTRIAEYWFFPLAEFYTRFDEYLAGRPFSAVRAGASFEADPEGSITVAFEPGLGQCLWVIRPEYATSKSFSQNLRRLSSISYVDRIQQSQLDEGSFLFRYLYTDIEQDWCYYYEKADLAYQYKEWDEVIQLWDTAQQNDLKPENGFEYLPFIEAYAHNDDWETAKKMTRTSQLTMQGIDPLLCHIWSNLESETADSVEKDGVISSVREDLKCDLE
jgi:hypothetical protein